MMRRRLHDVMCWGLRLAAAMLCLPALAAAPEVRVAVQAPQPVLVGQQVEIQVTVAAPNFFTSAPPFPPLAVEGAIVTMPDDRGVHEVETADGQPVATIRKSYVFVARRAGEFELPQVPIDFTYSGADARPQQAHLTLPATRIAARMPDGAQAGDIVLPTAALRISQSFDRDTAQIAAGDALVRTVQVDAAHTQAMLIPPTEFEAPVGVRVFAADPVLSDLDGRSGGFSGGRRIDKVTYVFEAPGRYTLPAVTLRWFDPRTRKPASAEAPAVSIEVKPAVHADAGIAPELPAMASAARHRVPWWRVAAWTLGLGLLGALAAWAWRQRARFRAWRVRRALARAQSDGQMFEQVLQACRRNDARATHAALLRWSRAHASVTPTQWAQEIEAPELAAQIDRLERQLFASGPDCAMPALAGSLKGAHRTWRLRQRTSAAIGRQRGNRHALQALDPLAPR